MAGTSRHPSRRERKRLNLVVDGDEAQRWRTFAENNSRTLTAEIKLAMAERIEKDSDDERGTRAA